MASVITIAGEQLFAAKAQANEKLDIDTFIFANVPGQDPNAPINRSEGIPTAHIVHQQIVQQVGRINENVVVYSTVLDSVTGPFEFNWVGLYSSVNDKLVAINHVPTVTKTVTEPGAAGNTLNRNFGIEYSGIAELAGITVAPETWQLDFTARLTGMDELTRQLAADMNGKDWFIGDGFKVVPRSTVNTFKVTAGAGYVSGLRVELAADHILTLSSYPQFVYVDAWFDGTSGSTWKGQTAFTVTNTEMDDYIDLQGKQHYLFKLAEITAADAVKDLRKQGVIDKVSVNVNTLKSLANAKEEDGRYYNVTSFYAGWAAQIKKPSGGGLFVFDASYDKEKHDGVLVIAPESLLAWDGTVADLPTLHDWAGVGLGCFVRDDFRAHVNYAGAIADEFITDNKAAIQGAFNSATKQGLRKVHFGEGKYLTSPGIIAASTLELIGVYAVPDRTYNMPTQIKFDDDQVNNSGEIGITFNSGWQLSNIQFLTRVDDARGLDGNFTGVTGDGRQHSITNCIIRGFRTFADISDIGYAFHTNLIWRGNGKGVSHRLVSWPFGTTLNVRGSIGVQNTIIYDVPNLAHSHWSGCIYEYCVRGVNGFSVGCSFNEMYGEGNTEYTVYSDKAGAANFSAIYSNGAGDGYVATGTTSDFGFDRLGATFVQSTGITTRELQFYTREGDLAGKLKASSNSAGRLDLISQAEDVIGSVSTAVSDVADGRLLKTVGFLLYHSQPNGVGSLPAGWTITKIGVGTWRVLFGPAIRTPIIAIATTASGVSTQSPITYDLTMRESSGGVWAAFQQANGFDLVLKIAGTASDSAAAFVTIMIP